MLPLAVGAGFKPEHFGAIQSEPGMVGFFEIHAENYMGEGGLPHAMLDRLRHQFALSVHGVGLSIGGAEPLNMAHLCRLKALCDRYQPESFSEHLAWSSHQGTFFNDLLPLPYTEATLQRVIGHVQHVQEFLGRRILLENPATYLSFGASTIPEAEFLEEISRASGCGLLLDVNNVYVTCQNRNERPETYLQKFPWASVGEIHLAGHEATTDDFGSPLLIDSHNAPVVQEVWQLYDLVLDLGGRQPTLIEWDNALPEWPVLAAEAERASGLLMALRRAA